MTGEPLQRACTVAAAPRKPPASPTPPAFHLQEIPAEFVAPIFFLLQPDASIIPPRAPCFHSGDNKTSWILVHVSNTRIWLNFPDPAEEMLTLQRSVEVQRNGKAQVIARSLAG